MTTMDAHNPADQHSAASGREQAVASPPSPDRSDRPQTLRSSIDEKIPDTYTVPAKEDDQDEIRTISSPPASLSTPTSEDHAQDGPEDAPPVEVSAPEEDRTKTRTNLIMFALCSALFLAALDITIISTAVPTIAAEFNSNLGYTWIGSAFILANAASVPTWGKISDIWGRKPILLFAAAVFWLGSLLCGVSVSMGMLIAARAIQGAGAGGVIALANIVVSDLFSLRTRGFYFSILGVVWGLASAIGPLLGGVFTTKATWRWCFYCNLPISGVGMLVIYFALDLHNPRTPVGKGLAAVDWLGSLSIVGGTLMFLFGLEFGGTVYAWNSAATVCLLVFGAITIGIFLFIEARVARYPIIPLRIFLDRSNVAAFTTSFCHAFVFLSGSYWLPLYFQAVLAVSSLQSGVYLLPYILALSVVSVVIGFIIRKTGNYKIGIVSGMAVMTLGFGLFIDFEPRLELAKLIIFQVIAGLGAGTNFQSPLIALQTTVEPREIASVTSAFAFVRQLAGSISIVVGGAVFSNKMQSQHDQLLAELGPDLASQLSGQNAAASVTLVGHLQGREGQIAREAYFRALQTMYTVYVAFGAFGTLASLFVRQKKLNKQHTEHKTGLKTLQSREKKAKKNTEQDGEKA